MAKKGRESRPVKVALVVDLSYYNPSLKPGAEGVMNIRRAKLVPGQFVSVSFPFAPYPIDVCWDHLKYVDDWAIAEAQQIEDDELQRIKDNATKVTVNYGLRGGFRSMVVEFEEGKSKKIKSEKEAEKIAAVVDDEIVVFTGKRQ